MDEGWGGRWLPAHPLPPQARPCSEGSVNAAKNRADTWNYQIRSDLNLNMTRFENDLSYKHLQGPKKLNIAQLSVFLLAEAHNSLEIHEQLFFVVV